jgi:exopolysaccharide biosynthesis predicted pyruvyltransferase EpsI
MIIITPGPTVNELTHCVGRVHMAWFGVSVTNWAVETYSKHKNCLKFLAVREEVSYDKASRMLDPHFDDVRLMLSGDMSFSYKAVEADVNMYKKQFQDSLGEFLRKENWVLIFSRENNFGPNKGIMIQNNKVIVTTIEGGTLQFNVDDVVFASSSDLEDSEHMKTMKTQYHFQRNRLVIFDSIEEMWSLISLSHHVVTDRYHPGIASLIIGTKLTLTSYPNENVKMSGLKRMQEYTREDIRGMNEKAFDRLLAIFHRPKVAEHVVTSL